MNRDVIVPVMTEHIKQLPYAIVSMATDWAQKDMTRPKGSESYLLMQCLSGYGYIMHQDERYEIQPNTLMIWSPETPTYYYNTGEVDWSVNWISFQTDRLPVTFEDGFLITDEFPVSLGTMKADTIKELLLEESISGQIRAASVLYDFLSEISIYSDQHEKAGQVFDLKPVTSYMKQNMSQQVNLEGLSKLFGVSPSYLCKLFGRSYKTTPMQFFMELRMSKAKALLLANTEEKIGKIGELCGYTDQVYFSRVFKKYTGQTPSVYRRENV